MTRMLTALIATFTGALDLCAEPPHVGLMREAVTAARAGDNDTTISKLEQVALLRPDYPRAHLNLARLHAAAGNADGALVALKRLAEMGVRVNVADPAFDSLRDTGGFQELSSRLTTGPDPTGGESSSSLTIDGVTGIIESCLQDSGSGGWFFGDVRNRCIWKSGPEGGALLKFTSDADALDGVFRLAWSADGRTLWASTATVGVMTGDDAEDGRRSALVAIDAATGRVRARFATPDDGHKHLIGDFAIARDGAIFATDSLSPLIWRLPAGGAALEPWLEHDDFVNLQGLTFGDDGNVLFAADYSNGIWRIDVATKAHSLIAPPSNASFFGIDALALVGGGILAVQNGVNSQRVLHITPSTDAVSPARVVACGLPGMTDLALGSVRHGRFHFVANSGWALFDPAPEKEQGPREVTIVSVPVE